MAADEAICPHCDHIIDTSFLSDEVAAPAPRRAAASSGAPRRTGARPSAGAGGPGKPAPRRRPPPGRPSPRTPARQDASASRFGSAEYDPDLDGPLEQPSDEVPSYENLRAPRSKTGTFTPPDEALREMSAFFKQLGLSDQLAFFGALTIALSCFFPWKSTLEEGDVLGMMSLGVVTLIISGILMGAVAIRVQRFMPRLHPLIPWLVQLASAGFSALWILIFMRLAWDSTEVPSPIGNYTMMRSSPSFGAWVALIGAGVSLTGTLLGLKEKTR